MAGFQFTSRDSGHLLEWEGDPDDSAAHLTILGWLQSAVTTGFVPASNSLSNRVKGNLGEFIAHKVGESYVFTNQDIAFAANAWDPLSDISRPDLDIVWLHFGTTPADDWAAIQEVKTTGQSTLVLADDLIQDYEKLFAENPRFTLRTRLDGLKNRLEQLQMGHLAPRLTELGGSNPARSVGISIVPTLIHDAVHDSSTKMSLIRQGLIGKGWSGGGVHCWSIKLGDIDARLTRLARGQP